MSQIAKKKEDSTSMTRAWESQLRGHDAWMAEHLTAPDDYNREEGLDAYRFKGDWTGADLSGKDLRRADFRKVIAMGRANFDGADLRGARLDKVNLSGASFKRARLNGATFRTADLRDSDLSQANGLSCEHLAGSDLRGATLPEEVSEFEELGAIAEASKYWQASFQIIFALCGFSTLTILSMKDENLILHNGQFTTQLPILQAVVSPLMFAYMAPLVILVLYAYQVFYSLTVWRLLSFLPAYFPDGRPLDRRAHPMLINTFVRVELDRLKNEGHDNFQYVARGLIAFAGPPLTLTVFWISCLKMHDAALSGVQSFFVAGASFLFLFVMTLGGGILRGELKTDPLDVRKILRDRSWSRIALLFLLYAVTAPFIQQDFFDMPICGVLLILLIKNYFSNIRRLNYSHALLNLLFVGAINFLLCLTLSFTCFAARNESLKTIPLVDPKKKATNMASQLQFPGDHSQSLFPYLLRKLNYYPFLDLRGRVVSRRPDGWTGHAEKEGDEMLAVSGADLEGADLRSMDAERAFFAKANLRRAKLQNAYLRFANLRGADLSEAQLEGTYLRGANLRDANLQGADLRKAIFSADFNDPTYHIGPNFQGAKIDRTTLFDWKKIQQERVNNFALAYFGVSDLKEWENGENKFLQGLRSIGISKRTDDDLNHKSLPGATFDGFAMSGADLRDFDLSNAKFRGKQPDRDPRMDLTEALFSRADLTGADFTDADLTGADFSDANLDKTNFQGANLSGANFKGSSWKKAVNINEKMKSFLEFSDVPKSKP
jgi:uncharacterized protein YjbI with pentapeptide repeats